MSEKLKNVIEWIECIVIAVVLALLIRYYVGTPTVVQMESMYPSKTYISPEEADLNNPVAIYDNEPTNVFAKFAYYVLEWGKTSYIKRVIALPGEHVQIKEGKVYINGNELDESSYLKDDVQTEAYGGVFTDIVVPEGYIFAMGDNRPKSADCRRFGCIPISKIEGIVSIRFWPLNKFGTIKKAE